MIERRLHWFMHLLLIGAGSGLSYAFDLSWAQTFVVALVFVLAGMMSPGRKR
jgi:hypothetical protein